MKWLLPILILLLHGPARATTYALQSVQANAAAQTAGLGIPLPPISLSIAAGAIASGRFDFHATGPGQVSGDVADMTAFRVGSTIIHADGSGGLYSRLNLSLTFAPDGSLTSALFDWLGPINEFYLTGSPANFGGFFSPSDSSTCGYNSLPQYDCRLSGTLDDPADPSAVPEPGGALIAITALGLFWLCQRRLRRRL